MDHTECRITVLDRIHDNTHGKQIVDLIQRLILVDHLFIDTEEMFYPSVDLCLDIRLFHVFFYFIHNALDKRFPLSFSEIDLFHQIVIDFRLQIF